MNPARLPPHRFCRLNKSIPITFVKGDFKINAEDCSPVITTVFNFSSYIPYGVYDVIWKAKEEKRKAQTGCGYDSAGVYYCCDASGHCYAAKDPNKKKSIRIK